MCGVVAVLCNVGMCMVWSVCNVGVYVCGMVAVCNTGVCIVWWLYVMLVCVVAVRDIGVCLVWCLYVMYVCVWSDNCK